MAEATHWDGMYARPPESIPWEIEAPPAELVDAHARGVLPSGKALDIGCGTGNYALYLAKNGFEVTGVDFSERAIEIARQRAAAAGVEVRYVLADARKVAEHVDGTFEFILDYSVLHHIAAADVESYARQTSRLLSVGGRMMLICYSEKDDDAHGAGVGTGTYGNEMYYRTADEIRSLYAPLKEIEYREIRIGKRLHHAGHYFLFER